ncbi:MAG: calcium-binding protein [Moorea sp. SIO3C2]|nr:calcium-binding protein [Moorena sp. SIO3C2]
MNEGELPANTGMEGGEMQREPMKGGKGRDRFRGDDAADDMSGGRGRDRLRGEGGDDKMDGGAGRDRMHGGEGADEMLGGGGRDVMKGGAGDDLLCGGAGRDRMKGGEGADTFAYKEMRDKGDLIVDFDVAADVLDLSSVLAELGYGNATFNELLDDVIVLGQSKRGTRVGIDEDG